jgi:YHS domain-containing protein/thiol-disulfide isomerase/thioredoxin
MRSQPFALSLTLSFAAFFTVEASAAELAPSKVWKIDFAAAEAEAKQLHRPLVIHFHAPWCGPCRKMEREVLDTAQVLKIIDAGFVGVKVDVVKNPAVQKRFKVESLPTDMIVSPEGKVLVRSEGYDDRAGDRDFRKYLTNINRIDAQYAAEGKRLARTDAPAENKPQQPAVVANNTPPKTVPVTTTTPSASGDKLVPPPTEPKKVVEVAVESPATPTTEEEKESEVPVATDKGPAEIGTLLAMEGYCPVTLRMTRAWKTGSSDIAHEHEGQTFYFAAHDKRDEFKANPAKYAPRLMGCDPVVLSKNDLAVRGSVKFAAYYEGELFLFQSAESRAAFRKNPAHYAKLQHTLKVDDLKDVKKVATTAQ